jgi:predicted adenine nucleotide alpha hydrolase (AANH) superfamily ATPase
LQIVDADYDHEGWLEAVSGLEAEPERGGRCLKCFKVRLLDTARYAMRHGIRVITTTLASSRWKSLDQINEAGRWACEQVARCPEDIDAAVAPITGIDCDGMPLGAVGSSRLGVESSPVLFPPIWWEQNWRKGGLQERRLQIIKEYDFYNQLYCGCEFSMRKDV